MRCPKCRFVSSDKKDVCPSCQVDLRPYKHIAGLAISNPKASLAELIREHNLEVEALKNKKPVQSNSSIETKTSSGPEERRSTPAAGNTKTPARPEAQRGGVTNSPQPGLKPPPVPTNRATNAAGAKPTKPAEKKSSPISSSAVTTAALTPEVSDPLKLDVDLFSEGSSHSGDSNDSLYDQPENPLPINLDSNESFDLKPGPLKERPVASPLAPKTSLPSLEDNELDLLFAQVNQARPVEVSRPTVTPAVMEFHDDDELFQKALDEMIGDETIDVAAVKEEKPKVAAEPANTIVSDDIEISFEFEMDGEVVEDPSDDDEHDESGQSHDDSQSDNGDTEESVVEEETADDSASPHSSSSAADVPSGGMSLDDLMSLMNAEDEMRSSVEEFIESVEDESLDLVDAEELLDLEETVEAEGEEIELPEDEELEEIAEYLELESEETELSSTELELGSELASTPDANAAESERHSGEPEPFVAEGQPELEVGVSASETDTTSEVTEPELSDLEPGVILEVQPSLSIEPKTESVSVSQLSVAAETPDPESIRQETTNVAVQPMPATELDDFAFEFETPNGSDAEPMDESPIELDTTQTPDSPEPTSETLEAEDNPHAAIPDTEATDESVSEELSRYTAAPPDIKLSPPEIEVVAEASAEVTAPEARPEEKPVETNGPEVDSILKSLASMYGVKSEEIAQKLRELALIPAEESTPEVQAPVPETPATEAHAVPAALSPSTEPLDHQLIDAETLLPLAMLAADSIEIEGETSTIIAVGAGEEIPAQLVDSLESLFPELGTDATTQTFDTSVLEITPEMETPGNRNAVEGIETTDTLDEPQDATLNSAQIQTSVPDSLPAELSLSELADLAFAEMEGSGGVDASDEESDEESDEFDMSELDDVEAELSSPDLSSESEDGEQEESVAVDTSVSNEDGDTDAPPTPSEMHPCDMVSDNAWLCAFTEIESIAPHHYSVSDELELSHFELMSFEPNDLQTVLFDAIEKEFTKPTAQSVPLEAVLSTAKQIDNADLEEALKSFVKAEKVVSSHRQQRQTQRATRESDKSAEHNTFQPVIASRLRRLLGWTIDVGVVSLFSTAIWMLAFLSDAPKDAIFSFTIPEFRSVLPALGQLAGTALTTWIVMLTYMVAARGQSFGQRLLGISVVSIDGTLPSLEQGLARALLQLGDLLTGGLFSLFVLGKSRRTLTDRLAKTIVVETQCL